VLNLKNSFKKVLKIKKSIMLPFSSISLFGRLVREENCWLICVREKYYFSWKFTIVYDKLQPNEQAAYFD